MADVDLLVAVRETGTASAVANLERLQKGSGLTAKSFTSLGTAVERTMKSIEGSVAGGARSFANFDKALLDTGKNAVSVSAAVKGIERTYAGLATAASASSAAQRLALAGGGDIEKAIRVAQRLANLRENLSADPVRDSLTYQRQQNDLLDARAAKTAALQSVERTRDDSRIASLSREDRAIAMLARAERELLQAQAAQRSAPRVRKTDSLEAETQKIRAQSAAWLQLASAEAEVARARREVDAAQDHALKQSNSAFGGSFAYFIAAGLAQQVTQGILSTGGAAITASSQIERSFADVDRTFEGTDAQLQSLKDKLRELATTTPNSFVDLAQIATLGNQLNISARDIQSFTTTIAQYTAVSGQSAEDAATAFGRVSNLTGLAASQYSNLASAITYVARTSVATESTIQNTVKEITALASGAGLSADAIVGLAGALSSLAIPPERARGALSLYFGALNSAVAEGGPKLAAFAQLTNLTADQLNRLVRENKGQEVFTAFISGLSQLDTVAKTTALDTLGLSTIRVDQTMRALAQNVPLVTSSFEGASQAFQQNTEIANQYAKIQDTLASKIIEFQNAIDLAAGAVGDSLAPALMALLGATTDIIVAFTDFAGTPIGGFVLGLAGAVTTLLLAFSALLGVVALSAAVMKVIPFALAGVQAKGLTASILQFIAGMLGHNVVIKEGTVQQVAFAGSLRGTAIAAGAATAGFNVMRAALIATGALAVVAILGTIVAGLSSISSAAKITAEDLTGLADAIKTDTATYQQTGEAVAIFSAQAAASKDDQDAAAQASANWAKVLGVDLVDGANAAADAVGQIVVGDAVVEEIRKALGNNTQLDALFQDSEFANTFKKLGLNMTDLIVAGIQSNGDKGKLRAAIDKMISGTTTIGTFKDPLGAEWSTRLDADGKSVDDFYYKLTKDLAPALLSTSTALQGTANEGQVLSDSLNNINAEELGNGFVGAKDSLTDFQSAVSSGVSKFVDFADILDRVKEASGITIDTDFVDPAKFAQSLRDASTSAVNFFNGITTLASAGKTQLATELAGLGPEAQGILSSVLALDPASQASIEADARFAAFLASDAFKTAYTQSMTQDFDAYALIFKTTGNLSDVQAYIAAQVAGTGTIFEQQWAIDHPDAPLNVTLQNPTDSEIEQWRQQLSGRLIITPVVGPIGSDAQTDTTIYTDTLTNKSIQLPAKLDGQALSDSLAIWQENQNASPEKLAALLNEDGLSASLDAWRESYGPIKLYATIVPTNNPQGFIGAPEAKKDGGVAGYPSPPKFATGGGYGLMRGPGTPRSDSIWAKLSRGEFVNTDASRRFWGTDTFASLERKEIPNVFRNMLAGAVSGNRGPQNVTNVQLTQVNPVVRDSLKQLREDSEMVAAAIW